MLRASAVIIDIITLSRRDGVCERASRGAPRCALLRIARCRYARCAMPCLLRSVRAAVRVMRAGIMRAASRDAAADKRGHAARRAGDAMPAR